MGHLAVLALTCIPFRMTIILSAEQKSHDNIFLKVLPYPCVKEEINPARQHPEGYQTRVRGEESTWQESGKDR